MTDAEKTEWRIRAAKAMGAKWYRKTYGPCQDRRILLFPEGEWELAIQYGHFVECDESVELYGDYLREVGNPFESAEDCEALLIATLNKRASELPVWKGTGRGSDMGAWWFGIDGHQQGVYVRTQSHRGQIEIETWSDNSERRDAYRESVIKACVRAFEAMEEAEIHPAKPLAEGNHTKRD